jgi:hypothetical protein
VSERTRAPIEPEALLADARGFIDAAAREGVPMRLLGGLGVYALAESARRPPLARTYRDFDVAVPARRGPAASRVLEAAGLVPDKHFNALHGARRMIFASPDGYPVDVLIGAFEMCHALEIRDGFDRDGLTITPAHLLLTKMQIVAIEPKDLADAAALVLDLPPGTGVHAFELDRFVAPLADDWGFFHTVELNLPKLRAFGEATLEPARARLLGDRLDVLAGAMLGAPKSRRWRMRSRIGERLTWYETPEEVDWR